MKGFHENILDFEILETGNSKTLVFVDSSEYMENPELPLLEVILPGMNKYLLVNISPRKTNVFNSNGLGITPTLINDCGLIDLPDGIWTFKYKICPYKYVNRSKTYLRITNLLLNFNKVLDTFDITNIDIKNEIVDISLLIESARASAALGHTERASNKYNLALKKVNILLDKIK